MDAEVQQIQFQVTGLPEGTTAVLTDPESRTHFCKGCPFLQKVGTKLNCVILPTGTPEVTLQREGYSKLQDSYSGRLAHVTFNEFTDIEAGINARPNHPVNCMQDAIGSSRKLHMTSKLAFRQLQMQLPVYV